MKALSLTQPWATLVAIGAKRYETRSWNTNHRGPIAIHAAKGFPKDCQQLCEYDPFDKYIASSRELPLGAIIAVADLVTVHRTEWVLSQIRGTDEEKFGDYSAGRFAWFLNNVRKLPAPIPCKGALGLWEVPISVASLLPTT